MSVGRIPFFAARRYAIEELEFSPSMWRLFWRIISAIDDGFLQTQRNEHDRRMRESKPKSIGGRSTSKRSYR